MFKTSQVAWPSPQHPEQDLSELQTTRPLVTLQANRQIAGTLETKVVGSVRPVVLAVAEEFTRTAKPFATRLDLARLLRSLPGYSDAPRDEPKPPFAFGHRAVDEPAVSMSKDPDDIISPGPVMPTQDGVGDEVKTK
eukprot:gene3368-3853_t